ncbi:HECT-domain (ubiquitin-transferase) domain-containing protein, partial [Cardiosporidium cionae]
YLVEDGLDTLGRLEGYRLKQSFRVQFVDTFGQIEEGIDGGGLFKEFLIRLSRTAFNPIFGLFESSADNFLYPSPSADIVQVNALELFSFLGKLCGKALYEKTLIEPCFGKIFLNLILGRSNQVDDVASIDSDLHKNLLYLKTYEGNVEDFSLTFSVTIDKF